MSDTVFHLGQAAKNIKSTPSYQPYSKVRIIVGEDENGTQLVYEAGNDSARIMEITNPYGTQAMANAILNRLRGYQYRPYNADGVMLNPASELGDGIAFAGDVYSFIASAETTLSPIMSANVAAYEDGEVDHEYPYESPESKEIIRKFNGLETSFIVQLGLVESRIADTYETKSDAGSMRQSLETKISQTKNDILLYASQTYETITGANGLLDSAKAYADGIGVSVTQAYTAAININAQQIKSTVASSTTKYLIPSGVTITLYGYGDPATFGYKASDYNGQSYLDQSTGYYYTSNGTSWTKSSSALQKIDDKLSSDITQTANSIKSTVASATSKFDLSVLGTEEYPWTTGSTFQNFGYGVPSNSTAKGKNGQYYLDQASGIYYKSNNFSWVKQNTTALPLITDNLSSMIEQTASSIAFQVSGANAPEWESGAAYAEDDVVKITTKNSDGIVVGTVFYKALSAHESTDDNKPPSNKWELTDAPTVQSLIDVNLDEITLKVGGSNKNNSASISIYRGSVIIDSKVVTMSNVVAESLDSQCILTDGLQLDGALNVRAIDGEVWKSFGGIGASFGDDGVVNTKGCILRSAARRRAYNYLIATTSGVRMQYLPAGFDDELDDEDDYPNIWVSSNYAAMQVGDYRLYVSDSGIYATNGTTTKNLLA